MATPLSVNFFKSLIKSNSIPTDALLQKAATPEPVQIEPDSRKAIFTISTSTVDRQQDSIDVKGWKLENYNRNPVVLFGHDVDSLPIGKARVYTEGTSLKAEVEFADASVNPLAEQVYQGVKQGFINATSVGFNPIEFDISEDTERKSKAGRVPPVDFRMVELLELSIVTVPANPEALIEPETISAAPKAIDKSKLKAKRARAFGYLTINAKIH